MKLGSAACSGIKPPNSHNCGKNASDTDSDSRNDEESRAPLSSHRLASESLAANVTRKTQWKRKVDQSLYEHPSTQLGLQSSQRKAPSSDYTSSSSDAEQNSGRAKDDGWPHPLAKLIGQGGGASNYFKESREGREMVTQNRDFVRDHTKNLRRSIFPTSR
eukprot:TCALIF_05196-PA protein Name:"Protein of unknown function" AED:0.05 eAED:0.05 QI:0/0.5/0/1/0/0/3/0/160